MDGASICIQPSTRYPSGFSPPTVGAVSVLRIAGRFFIWTPSERNVSCFFVRCVLSRAPLRREVQPKRCHSRRCNFVVKLTGAVPLSRERHVVVSNDVLCVFSF